MRIEPPPTLSVESDIELRDIDQQREDGDKHGAILAVIAIGGALGSVARYGLTLAWPTPPGGFPWAVFTINVVGCFLLGILMVVVTEIRPAHPLVRPFLGVGVLGGFTTFSTYTNDIHALLDLHTVIVAVAYLVATLVVALTATALAVTLTRVAARFARVSR
ncbi:fluoride efflux transporter CrcB [Nocardia sp. CS682]|uniref:fluoride efflux transporter CrcB n=1 Tax=Nocardia sp. CS682 TaxID=1047172 RepID=UPI001074FD37|nr:fluoride efflux transporter CrcB [Nocardia sp. CS682]QBS44482.1 fluoride efflux transporter CrcB [Nocardia sp. CS682]